MNPLDEAKNLLQLEVLKSNLTSSGLTAELIEKNDTIDLDVLVVGLKNDFKGRPRTLNITFIPTNEDDIKELNFIQFHSEIPDLNYEFSNQKLVDFLLEVNTKMLIGHFSKQHNNKIGFRYILSTPKFSDLSENEVFELYVLIQYQLDAFSQEFDSFV